MLAVPQGQHGVFGNFCSYTEMQLWWNERISLCSHQDETLMLGMFTKMQLWWWVIFLFAHIKMWCKEWLAVPHGQLSVIFVYLSSYTMMQLWWWEGLSLLLKKKLDKITYYSKLAVRHCTTLTALELHLDVSKNGFSLHHPSCIIVYWLCLMALPVMTLMIWGLLWAWGLD